LFLVSAVYIRVLVLEAIIIALLWVAGRVLG
jgi:hypothetical protein